MAPIEFSPVYEESPGEFARFHSLAYRRTEARDGFGDYVARVEAWLSDQGL